MFSSKNKLLVVSTKELRHSRLRNKTIQVRVGNQTIQESNNEKLLGITMSNDMTWNALLYGNKLTGSDKEIGLLKQLSQRIGMLKQLSKNMSKSQLNNF